MQQACCFVDTLWIEVMICVCSRCLLSALTVCAADIYTDCCVWVKCQYCHSKRHVLHVWCWLICLPMRHNGCCDYWFITTNVGQRTRLLKSVNGGLLWAHWDVTAYSMTCMKRLKLYTLKIKSHGGVLLADCVYLSIWYVVCLEIWISFFSR